ncbi:M13 family peptidase [Flavobacterium sp. Sd200]|uniref:M13 family metallopeptidase n=1 Tax=Flavobacterium sp. Sd200 TaxID=2692211 RepID=UPI00136A1036|nr:M13 family metallopeptidase [Flavobacterium sp. Sd200]MXN91458.1 M13 family peptidase [Flavobacterium sp. Sd200]
MQIAFRPFLMAASALLIIGCSEKETQYPDPLVTNRDTTVNPSDNFFMYANGGWFKHHPIPDSERSNGIFRTIADTVNAQVKAICEKAAGNKNAAKGSNEQKIGDFYASGLDTIAIEKEGLKPLAGFMQRIDAVKDVPSLMQTVAYLHTVGTSPLYGFYIGQDDKISTKHAAFFSQARLGIGNRDYYFNDDAEAVNIRAEYVKYVAAVLKIIGEDTNAANTGAANIMKLETALASSSRKLEELRDPIKNYNKVTLAAFNASTPDMNWGKLLPEMGVTKVDTVIVGQPEYFAALNKMVKTVPLNDLKTYLKFNLVNSYAPYLNEAVADENFHFYSTVMGGVTKQRPRWKRVVEETNSMLGELIGQVYVKDYLPKGTKEKLVEIGNNIREVYAERIKNLDWMSEPTKKKALQKLSRIIMKVGYPDKWKDMSSVTVGHSYCGNVIEVAKWHYRYMIAKYGKPVDRTEWSMTPQTYNAYYNPSNNEIVVPACNIVVPGFEGRLPDDAILYGIIGGSVFGHEITHGFDDQGAQYDDKGNLNNWWTPEDLARFNAKTKLIVDQFNKFEALPGKFVNGDATQGENIADLGGVVMGYEAFKKTPQFKENQKISGFTPQQRYFLAYAYAWMVNIKKEALSQQIMTDVHAPAQYRINGPLANMPEFYEAFSIKQGSSMRQPDSLRVVIW